MINLMQHCCGYSSAGWHLFCNAGCICSEGCICQAQSSPLGPTNHMPGEIINLMTGSGGAIWVGDCCANYSVGPCRVEIVWLTTLLMGRRVRFRLRHAFVLGNLGPNPSSSSSSSSSPTSGSPSTPSSSPGATLLNRAQPLS